MTEAWEQIVVDQISAAHLFLDFGAWQDEEAEDHLVLMVKMARIIEWMVNMIERMVKMAKMIEQIVRMIERIVNIIEWIVNSKNDRMYGKMEHDRVKKLKTSEFHWSRFRIVINRLSSWATNMQWWQEDV